jgi:sulfonate transport system permease protein
MVVMKKLVLDKASKLLLGLIIPILIIAGMEAVGRLELTTSQLFVSPEVIFATLTDLLKDGDLLRNLGISFLRVSVGFLIGAAGGGIFGAAMGLFPRFEEYSGPLFNGLRQIPALAWIPLLILWVGIGENFKICFIALTVFYPMALNACEGVKGVSKAYLEVGHIFELGHLKQISTIIIPAALPSFFSGLRLSLSIAWMAVVGAELVAASEGIGYMMFRARRQLQVDTVIICIIAIGLTGFALSLALEKIERYSLRWRRTDT